MTGKLKLWAARQILKERRRPQGLTPLKECFMDLEGRRYYTWGDLTLIPVVRYRKIETFLIYDEARISADYLDKVMDAIVAENMKIPNEKDMKSRAQAHARITALANEVKYRRREITPEDTFYAVAAMLSVREDEDPETVDSTIFNEKVRDFKAYAEEGHTFFFKNPMCRALWPWLIGTEDSYANLLNVWKREGQKKIERLSIILGDGSESSRESSTTY